MATGDKENWWEEYHGFTQDFKEDGYKPDVKIEHMEEMNWKHTPKEAFWHLSHHCHGKGSSKMKMEWWMKKLDKDVAPEELQRHAPGHSGFALREAEGPEDTVQQA